MREKKCECCGNILKQNFHNQKFCNNCSVYFKNLRAKLYYYKSVANKLQKEKRMRIENES